MLLYHIPRPEHLGSRGQRLLLTNQGIPGLSTYTHDNWLLGGWIRVAPGLGYTAVRRTQFGMRQVSSTVYASVVP